MNQFWPTIFRLKEYPLSFRQTRSRPSRTYQDSSYSHNMLEHFEQKFLSDEAVYSSGVPRFMTALYTLASVMIYTNESLEKYLICSLPSILRVFECAPRLMEPPTPPTFLQMEHTQSCSDVSSISLQESWKLPGMERAYSIVR